MNRLPDCMVVIDPKKEKNAIKEARKLGIVTLALIDTDCDPDVVDLPIPGNDDGLRSIEIIVRQLADAIIEGKAAAITKEAKEAKEARKGPAPNDDEATAATE
jgi:small subunit ribosomal protein S2